MLDLQIKKSTEQSSRNNVYDINKASPIKRFGAFLMDMIILVVLITGFLYLTSAIVKYDEHYEKLEEKYVEHGVFIPNEESAIGYVACEIVIDEAGNYDENDSCLLAQKSFNEDEDAVKYNLECNNLMLLMLSISSLLAVLLSEFVVPILIPNNKTIGYWSMHIGLISKECVKPKKVQLFARAVIGRWALETVPIILVGAFVLSNGYLTIPCLIIVFGLAILEVICAVFSKNHIWLHDLVANTVPVDADSQYFAPTLEDLEEKRKGV